MFPAAAPGYALILLRTSAAVSVHLDLHGHLAVGRPPWMIAVLVCVSLVLLLGFVTPLAALATAAIEVVPLVLAADNAPLAAFLLPLRDVALALLGPGAYSLDAHLFGRRVLILPQRRP
ncbi:hypothetical protein TMPK1_19510 [Rhodospirillales bacterium TMPK1]|uniref:Uncharacterized protein n=2 Tax=Roseiterribacter gracilis TaxID=2812848 RepID=A0A8S8XAD1_9PROT|nr:hypothetical protein TMPK1_19510 [Rhodospirillales bacterium TMPK1]